jgi:SecD/SecF fusion protein
MRNKGAIKFFAIALALVSIYQLSFTYFTGKVEREAKEFSQGDAALEYQYLDSMASEPVYNFFWIKKFTYRECQEKEINLGLDLKGGMNVTMEVSVVDVIRSLAGYTKDTTFNNAIFRALKMQENSQEDFVTLFGMAFKEINPNGRLASFFSTMELRDKISFKTSDEDVLKFLSEETKSAYDNTFNILRNRIDRFGVSQPNISRLEGTGRVMIELPGVKEPERVRKLLQGTANLEFWETYENNEIYSYFIEVNKKIKEINESEAKAKTDSSKTEASPLDLLSDKTAKEVLPKADTTKSIVDELLSKDTTSADTAQTDAQAAKDYPLFMVLRPNVTQSGELMKGSGVGIAHYKDTMKVNRYLNMKQVKVILPPDVKFLWSYKPIKGTTDYYELIAIRITTREKIAPLDGSAITSARPEFGQSGSTADVSMGMNSEGAKVWARLTRENVGKQIAVVLDNYVYSNPVVQSEIKGGRSSITGDFTITEATDLANVLKSGKLPAPARIIEEAIVGPSLGKEAIQSGLLSFIFAFLIVLLYMLFYYNRAGLTANIALLVNVLFIMGVLASLGAVLTLPGIAGLVLTLGMAVDANVIIYERIREEIRAGKGIKLAVSDGYKNAYSAIIDGNITTLITGIILFIFGSGPVQGFATMLIIGILTSLFSSIFITRLVFEGILNKNKNISWDNKFTRNFLVNTKLDFIKTRKITYVISTILIIASISSLTIRGLNMGIDFTGGRTYVVRFDQPVKVAALQSSLKNNLDGQFPEVKTFGSDNQVKIATKFMMDNLDPAIDVDSIVEARIYNGLKPFMKEGISFDDYSDQHRMSSQKVGPTIAHDITIAAAWAIFFSLIGIFLYIFIRFKNWRFGLGGVSALVHDTIITLGIFSIFYDRLPFSMEIDQAFIAAILTVIGYSINDTVIIFDRIREYLGIYKRRNRKELVNGALNSTLIRTMNTSFTTIVVLLTIFIFGGEVIRGFIFALLIGIIVGTYSSWFVATPLYYDTSKREEKID